ncbi:MAG: DUF4160 domain-containing protein [Planctomycetes bacterium]|nr:DUF4160 domain-containing protein [Planctomycetota bacterium]
MSEISRFLGIVIKMYHREHGPPHFHARYGEYEVSIQIWSGVVTGRFPPRALRHVMEWYDLHRIELLRNWELGSHEQPLERIDPLE